MQLVEVAERFGLALHEDTFLAVFRGRCRSTDVFALRKQLARWVRKRDPARCRVLVVMENRATLGQKGRAEIGLMLKERSGLKAWANVVEGAGFWASAVRGITTTVLLVTRPGFPLRSFADVATAWEWLGDGAPSAELIASVAELRSRVGSTAPSTPSTPA
jgi:hypothetical protein